MDHQKKRKELIEKLSPKNKPTFTWANIKPMLKARARTDPKFREQLLHDPKTAFETVTGHPLPPNMKIRPVVETETDLYVVVPKPAKELTDKDFKLIESDRWALLLDGGEDCPGDGNPPTPPFPVPND